jgi:hypothetical protein
MCFSFRPRLAVLTNACFSSFYSTRLTPRKYFNTRSGPFHPLESSSATAHKRGVANWASFGSHSLVGNVGKSRVFIWSWSRRYRSNTVRCLRELSLSFSANFTGVLREPRCGHPCCRVFQAHLFLINENHFFFIGTGLSIFCLVVLCFSCRLDCTRTLAWECVYVSSLILVHLVLICLYYTQFFFT